MDLILKTGRGGLKQIGQPIVNRPGEIAVLATFDVGPLQRLLLALFMEGVLNGGHTLYDEKRGKFLVGDDASKETGLWLDELPPLVLGDRFPGRWVEWPCGSGKMVERWSNQTDSGQNRLSPDDDRWLKRSETYPGLAEAFGFQWGWYLLQRGRRYA